MFQKNSTDAKVPFGQRAIMPLMAFLLFGALYAGLSYGLKPDISMFEDNVRVPFQMYGPFAGFAFGFLSMLGMYLVRILGFRKFRLGGPLLIILGYAPWAAFGYQLVYREPRYALIAKAIITFMGQPMLYASAAMVGLGVLFFMVTLFTKTPKHLLHAVIIALILLPLNGCLGFLIGSVCDILPDSDHCNQAAAIQNADTDECAKIQGKAFGGTSNPPKDKCYLQIAENTGEYGPCDKIEGGFMSYTKEECVSSTAIKNDDPGGCRNLKGPEFDQCKQEVGATITVDKLKEMNDKLEAAKSALGADPENADLKKEYDTLVVQKKDFNEFASTGVKNEYFKQGREELMTGMDDDVKSVVAKQFVDFRTKNPTLDNDQLLQKMAEIKDRQETVKSLDDQVNEVFDGMKDSMTDFVKENADEATGASKFAEEMQGKGMEWFKENGGDRVKRGIENLEWMKDKYDKASEQYKEISDQIAKIKKVYDEAAGVYTKIDAINKLVAEGKIDKGKASVLHGAVLLGKGLEYATEYVPVFGSTVSKITKATFEETVKFATKRAQRTTAIDKCIDDPEHCDPNGISAY